MSLPTRPLGPDADSVSVVAYGGMPLSIAGRPPEAQGVDVIHAVLDAGVTFIDTADVYCLDDADLGHNERLIAQALRTWSGPRDHVLVGTKGGLTRPRGRWERDGHPDHLRRSCEQSLRALAVDRIDLYQLHAPDPRVPFAESVGALDGLRAEGKVRWIGLSNVSTDQIREAQAITPIATVQNRLNPFFGESPHPGVVRFCDEHGLGFLAYSPVGGGRLNRKLPDHPTLRPITAAHDATPHEVVLAWVLAQGESVIVIPGARSIAHAVSSTRAARLQLTEAEVRAISQAEFSTA